MSSLIGKQLSVLGLMLVELDLNCIILVAIYLRFSLTFTNIEHNVVSDTIH